MENNKKFLIAISVGMVLLFIICLTIYFKLSGGEMENKYPELYDVLLTGSKEYGFYLNKDVSIDNISTEEILTYALEDYITENNVWMNGIIECAGEEKGSEWCAGMMPSSINKNLLDEYIKNKFNTSKTFTLTANYNGVVNGYNTGEYIYDPYEQVYYVGHASKSGGAREIIRKFIKSKEDENNIYIYDKAFYCIYDMGFVCSSQISNEYPQESDALVYYDDYEKIDENKKYDDLIISKDTNEYETVNIEINSEYVFKKYKNKINTYKHTFKKGIDGKYYWYSTEID